MTGRTLAPLLRGEIAAGARPGVRRARAACECAARRSELSGQGDQDGRLSLHPELPARIAGPRATRNSTSRSVPSATSTEVRPSRSCSTVRAIQRSPGTSNSPPRSVRPRSSTICAAIRTRLRTSPASPSTAKRRNVCAPIGSLAEGNRRSARHQRRRSVGSVSWTTDNPPNRSGKKNIRVFQISSTPNSQFSNRASCDNGWKSRRLCRLARIAGVSTDGLVWELGVGGWELTRFSAPPYPRAAARRNGLPAVAMPAVKSTICRSATTPPTAS